METFEVRHNKQKLFSTLMSMDLCPRVSFNWYVHGPYSTGLAKELFFIEEHKDTVSEQIEKIKASNEGRIFQEQDQLRLKKAIDTIGKARLEDKDFMEALGSLAYLYRTSDEDARDLDALVGDLTKRKPHLSRETIKQARHIWSKLQHDLKPA